MHNGGMHRLIGLLFFILSRTLYKVRVEGASNFPKKGAAVLAANRLSLMDMLFLALKTRRTIHFLIPKHLSKRWWMRSFADFLKVVPVETTAHPGMMLKELRAAGALLDKGEIVCLYPEENEGQCGPMLSFRRSLELILTGRDCPVVPLYIDNLWGGLFDDKLGRQVARRFPHPVQIAFGKPFAGRVYPSEVIQEIQKLGHKIWMDRKRSVKPLHHTFVYNTRRKLFKKAMGDETSPSVSYFRTLTGSIAIGRKLKKQWEGQEYVGILLPQCCGAVLANAAVTFSGRAVVNLNFSTGAEGIAAAVDQANIKTVVSSRKFLEKIDLELPEHLAIIYLEDVKKTIGFTDRLTAMLLALTAPVRLLEKACGAKKKIKADDTLTVIFTSGSTGEPKGVVLTHFNVGSNADAISQAVLSDDGNLSALAILPFFHAFGYMLLWLGLNYDLTMILHPNPLDYNKIGELAERFKISIIISTPTFLRGYLKKVPPEKLRFVRCVLTGAERMPRLLADAFEEKFNIVPIEGFGTSECSPVVSTNILDCRSDISYPCGFIPGTVGPPLPGVMVKAVDPETFDDLPYEIPGMILVKGPNVMKGYLHRDDLTDQVMRDGWYVTGDIGFIDQDGYLHITDRISRFSKIGGEMIPHWKIEEALHEAADLEPQAFAVTSVPDRRKGERLVVFHTYDQKLVKDLIRKVSDNGLPNLFIPRKDQFFSIDKLPVLSSGKLDLRTLKRMAESRN